MYYLKRTTYIDSLNSLTLLSGCNAPATSNGAGKRQRADLTTPFEIVSTCGMVTDIVKHVAGSAAPVTGIMNE